MLIFISYSRVDEKFILKLADDLRKYEVPIWLDQYDILPGKVWVVAIEEALANASHFLLVMSKASVQSENVLNELDFALEEKKEIIPILIDNCRRPLTVRTRQYIDFQLSYDNGLENLMKLLIDQKLILERELPVEPVSSLSEITAEKSTNIIDISGQWVQVTGRSMFLTQEANLVAGFYDYGGKEKVGIYIGTMQGTIFNYRWAWLDGTLWGEGQMILSTQENTLTQYWWFQDRKQDDAAKGIYQFVSKEMPNWLDSYDFSRYKAFFELVGQVKLG